MLVVGSAILSPLYSQSEKDSTRIANIDLDSLYSKAIRGLAAIEDNRDKKKALVFCDSAKAIQSAQIVGLKEIKFTYENTITILKKDKKDLLLAVKMANEQIKIEKKIGKKKFWSGITWGGLGLAAIEVLVLIFAK